MVTSRLGAQGPPGATRALWLKLARSAVPGMQPLSGPKPRLPQGERELTSIKCLPHVGVRPTVLQAPSSFMLMTSGDE